MQQSRLWYWNYYYYAIFRKTLLAFIRTVGNIIYSVYNPFGVRLINSLRLGFTSLRDHKLRHNFVDTVNLLFSCTLETEETEYFFLRSQNNLSTCTTVINELNSISNGINSFNSTTFIKVTATVEEKIWT